jgi:hypothetical protein
MRPAANVRAIIMAIMGMEATQALRELEQLI